MDTVKTIVEVLSILAEAVGWIVERMRSGETPDAIKRDMSDRRDEVRKNREARDKEFREKFGRDPVDPLG